MVCVKGDVRLWNDRKIPYVFEREYPLVDAVLEAMRAWEETGEVWFTRRYQEEDYIIIRYKPDISSQAYVGRKGGEQEVIINNDYTALHELGHVLGLYHEQQRSDRDNYIDIKWDNIINGDKNGNFTKFSNTKPITANYDECSVMQYPAPAKGWQGNPPDREVWTMKLKKDPNTKLGAGNHQGWKALSKGDKAGICALYRSVEGWGWEKNGPQGGTSHAPRFVSFNEKQIFSVWKKSNDCKIMFAFWDNLKGAWSDTHIIPDVSTSRSPAIAVHNNVLYAAWRGAGDDAGIWYATHDGAGWTKQKLVPNVATSEGPALCSFNGKLWMAWKGFQDDCIWYTTFDKTWAKQSQVPDARMSESPSLAVLGQKLFLAWKGAGNDSRIGYTTYDGSRWSGQVYVPGIGSAKGPSLASFGSKIWMCWRGVGDDGIWWANYSPEIGWSGQARITNVNTADSPTLAVLNGKLHLGWTTSDRNQLSWMSYPEIRITYFK